MNPLIRHREYMIDDDGRIRRLSDACYQRLLRGSQTMPHYARQRIRYASVLVEVRLRRPTGTLRAWYGTLPFDLTGTLDRARMRCDNLVLIDSPLDACDRGWNREENVVRAERAFIRRRLIGECYWLPTPELHRRILRLALLHARWPR